MNCDNRKIVHNNFYSHNPIRDLRQSCMTAGVLSVRDNAFQTEYMCVFALLLSQFQ